MLLVPPAYAHRSAGGLNVSDLFSADAYSGSGGNTTLASVDFSSGGMFWAKSRSNINDHMLFDTERSSNWLASNATSAQQSSSVTLSGSGVNLVNAEPNTSGRTYIGWSFRKAPKFFDVVTYTGNGSNRTIAHNLGVAPGLIIVKLYSLGGTNWVVYHRSLPNTHYLNLNNNTASASDSTMWNSVTADSSVFSVGTNIGVNFTTYSFVAYLFAHDPAGIIQCGTYTGNGSGVSPTVVSIGWEPQYLIVKKSSGIGDWYIYDSARSPTNDRTNKVLANSSATEDTSDEAVQFDSTSFRFPGNGNPLNDNGATYAYMTIKAT